MHLEHLACEKNSDMPNCLVTRINHDGWIFGARCLLCDNTANKFWRGTIDRFARTGAGASAYSLRHRLCLHMHLGRRLALFGGVQRPSGALHRRSIMLPGLVACLSSIFLFKRFPSISGRTPFVMLAGALVCAGTFMCTHPTPANIAALHISGLVLSGFFAITLIMAWFDTFARLNPRAIIAVSIAAFACWGILSCPREAASLITSALPLLSVALLPKKPEGDRLQQSMSGRTLREVLSAAVPLRTLLGLSITFFIVRSMAALAPEFERFGATVSPASLIAPLCITAFFIGSALLVKRHLDPSILYKILLAGFAGVVFLLASSIGITSSLVFYSIIVCEVMTWTMLSLWAKKTPVVPHVVFAVGWIAECAGNALGQTVAPLLAAQGGTFFAVAILIILAVGFAFSEGQLVLDMDLEESDACNSPAAADDAGKNVESGAEESDSENKAPSNTTSDDSMGRFAAQYDISSREQDVLALWIAGRGMRYIENELFISESTVKSHLRSIYRKCDVHNRDEIISLYQTNAK